MSRKLLAFAPVVLAVASYVAHGALTDSQVFRVVVDPDVSIVCLDGDNYEEITHDATDNDQSFTAQEWDVMCNDADGASITFEVATPFVHTTDSSFKRDCKLAVAADTDDLTATDAGIYTIGGAGSDETDYANADNDASVSVTSTDPGKARFDVTVTFITDTYSTLADGNYETTVVGTIAAN